MRLKDIGKEITGFFNPKNYTDAALIQKSMPATNYIGANGTHNYSNQPGFSIIDPGNWRSLIYGGYAAHNFIELFHCIPEIFAPIHAIASRIANADFQLRKWYNDEIIYNNADWNRLFNTPNPLQHFREFIYEAVVYELVTGNSFIYINTPSTLAKDYRNVSAIWNLPANEIEILHNKSLKLFTATSIDDLVEWYKLDDNNKFQPKDVLHIKAINLKWEARKLKGASPLLSADKAIANLIAVYEARNVIYTKRGAMGFIVSRKSDESGQVPLLKGEKEAIREDFQSTYGLTGSRGLIGITDQPIDYVNVGLSIKDLEPFAETEADAAAIYGALQVPFELAPKPKGETYANQENAEKGFYQNVIIPKAANYMQSLTNKLGLADNRLYLHASFDHIDALQENKKDKADVARTNTETARIRFLHGVITLNDFVVEAGYEKQANAIYDKRIFDMSDDELAKVKAVLTLKTVNNGTTDANGNATGNTAGSENG